MKEGIQMKIYGIYDTKNNEQCVRVGTLQEIMKYFGIPVPIKSLRRALRYIGSRYDLVYLFEEWSDMKMYCKIKRPDDSKVNIEKGEFVFLVGSSTAGKSTIIKLIMKNIVSWCNGYALFISSLKV